MKIEIKVTPKEIADLVLALQDRHIYEISDQADKTIKQLVNKSKNGDIESFILLKNLVES